MWSCVRSPRYALAWPLLLLALAACQPRPAPVVEPETAPDAWPAFDYQAAARNGAAVFELDPAGSRLEFVVRRAGALARLGHDHVIVASGYEAWVYWPSDTTRARAEMRVPLRRLEVDPAAARRRHDMEGDPDAGAIEGTQHNMLKKVLAAGTWPFIYVAISRLEGGPDDWELEATFTVRDHILRRIVPVVVTRQGDRMTVQGSLVVDHADLGLEPYSALAGAIRVAEPIELHFTLAATRFSR